ncbi:MAG: precorrin-6y C5,15-methyltransferase (decarboxylating) subunit CbiE [Burkholderia sp.]|nr:precorrin-6y C5,15-methyltransferase (decarboxylating) subunit CbiE [Burkholderia sp.]
MSVWLTIVGIGDGGYSSLARDGRRALVNAEFVIGAKRHLDMLPTRLLATREVWPIPFNISKLLTRRHTPTCVLASGDPMLFGVGGILTRDLPADEWRVLPTPSSLSLAAARLGWPLQDVISISLVGRPFASIRRYLMPKRRLFILSMDGYTPAKIAKELINCGLGSSRIIVFEHLGGIQERRIDTFADHWAIPETSRLNLVALDCQSSTSTPYYNTLTPGLIDEAYRHDGQLTKRDMRAITLARLAPSPYERLWDVGAGCGSISIEWMRSDPSCSAIAIESSVVRQSFIQYNREALGVPSLQLISGFAPDALIGLPQPDAIFIGGGITSPGMLATCWENLKPGGRLVANAVTLQSEIALAHWRDTHGGTLTRVSLAYAELLGQFDILRQALPIMVYEAHKK